VFTEKPFGVPGKEGSATVSVAAIGVPPMASGTRGTEPNGEWSYAVALVGGTPTSATETVALPISN